MSKAILIGAASVVGLLALFNSAQKKNNNPKIFVKKKLAANYNARTIPPFGIWITEAQKDNQALINHELVHWKQYQQKGLIKFYLDYQKQFQQFGYDNMPMEIEARANESDFCKLNYTHCVRNGLSNTVYNPNFLL